MVKATLLLSVAVPCLAKSTDSQVMLQVANLKRGGAIENMHGGVQTMQTRMESMLDEAVATGQTPKLEEDAYKTMLDALKEIESQLGDEKIQNDKDWVTANDLITKCNTAMDKGFTDPDGVNAYKKDAEDAAADHKTCRGNEDIVHGDEFAKREAQKAAGRSAGRDKPACPIAPPEWKYKYEPDVATAKRVLAALVKAGGWAGKHEKPVQDANEAFKKRKEKSDVYEGDCDAKQGTLETDFCEYEVSLRTTCRLQAQCIATAKATRATARKDLTVKETAEKLILKSCSKVRCYIKLLTLGKDITEGGYNKCRNQEGTYDDSTDTWNSDGPTKLNINWVDEKVEKKCDTTPVDVAPGDADWNYDDMLKEQSWLDTRTQFAEIESCDKKE